MQLIPGARYIAGLDLPFYVSRAMVNEKLTGAGFSAPVWYDRSKMPPPIDPTTLAGYREGWDEWVETVYQGPAKEMDLPAQPNWLAVIPPAVEGQAQPVTSALTVTSASESSKPTATPMLIGAGVLLDVLFFGYVFKKVKARKTGEQKGKSPVSPATLAIVGASIGILYLSGRKSASSQPNWDKPTASELNTRYLAAINMPTLDPSMWNREYNYFVAHGRQDLANNIMTRYKQLKASSYAATAAAAAAAAANKA